MSRSVSYPPNCAVVCFKDVSGMIDLQFDDFVYDVRELCSGFWPSLDDCDLWLGREDRALLENDHCYVGISEYCGLAAIWLKPKGEDLEGRGRAALADRWCAQVAKKFEKMFGEYRLVGRFSNGEAIYEKIEKVNRQK